MKIKTHEEINFNRGTRQVGANKFCCDTNSCKCVCVCACWQAIERRSIYTCMPFPLVLCESIGVLLTSEGIGKMSLDVELRGVFGRNAAELDSAAASTPGVVFDLRPDILS